MPSSVHVHRPRPEQPPSPGRFRASKSESAQSGDDTMAAVGLQFPCAWPPQLPRSSADSDGNWYRSQLFLASDCSRICLPYLPTLLLLQNPFPLLQSPASSQRKAKEEQATSPGQERNALDALVHVRFLSPFRIFPFPILTLPTLASTISSPLTVDNKIDLGATVNAAAFDRFPDI